MDLLQLPLIYGGHSEPTNKKIRIIYILLPKYGQGGALGLATYLRIGSNLEI